MYSEIQIQGLITLESLNHYKSPEEILQNYPQPLIPEKDWKEEGCETDILFRQKYHSLYAYRIDGGFKYFGIKEIK